MFGGSMKLLTKQEELFLLTILRIKQDAYLVNIREHILTHTGKDWAFGSIYMTVEKLRKDGLVQTYHGEPSAERGGKAIKYYRLTSEGFKALKESKKVIDEMWKDFAEYEKGVDVSYE